MSTYIYTHRTHTYIYELLSGLMPRVPPTPSIWMDWYGQQAMHALRQTLYHKTRVYMRSFGRLGPYFGHGMCEQDLLRRQPPLATGSADMNK